MSQILHWPTETQTCHMTTKINKILNNIQDLCANNYKALSRLKDKM